MNNENSKTIETRRFRLTLGDKLNLNKNMVLANLIICYTRKTLNLHIKTINLKFLPQLGMMNLICLMDHILLQISKTTLNLSLRNTKL